MALEEAVVRFALAFAFSLAFGLERQLTNKPIGFGTYIFVCCGSCGLSMAAQVLNPDNPLPLLGSIVTGIGFLGAGALLKTGDRIFGFKSAAAVWIFAIVGVLVGAGEFLTGSVLYGLIWVVITIDRLMERRGVGAYEHRVSLKFSQFLPRTELRACLGTERLKTIHESFDKKESEHSMVLLISERREFFEGLVDKLAADERLVSVRVE